jgi:hypothetical protein
VKAAVERCYEARAYDLLNSTITLLSKKHGQLKGVVQAMVEQAMGWLDEIKKREGTEKWLQTVETLRGVTEGKVRYWNRARNFYMGINKQCRLLDLLGNTTGSCYSSPLTLP